MKKILFASNFLLLGIILFQACNNRNTNRPAVEVSTFADDCTPQSLRDFNPLQGEDGSIDAFLAKQMSERYAADPFKGFISGRNNLFPVKNKQDTRSIWFDLGRLKNFIETVEKSVCEKDCKTPLNLGVRLYLIKYDSVTGPTSSRTDLRSLPFNYANRTSVFFVGTYKKNDKNIDFDPLNVGDRCMPTPFAELLRNSNGKYRVGSLASIRTAIAFGDSTAMNHGDLMPPPDGTGSFPTDN